LFSKACEYGIKATIFIVINSFEVSEEINSPTARTAKVLQAKAKHKVIDSVKGSHGGFHIEKNQISTIKISQIANALDGDKIYNSCGLGL